MLRSKKFLACSKVKTGNIFGFVNRKSQKIAVESTGYQHQLMSFFTIPYFKEINLIPSLQKEINFNVEESKRGAAMPLSVSMKTFFQFGKDDHYYILQSKSDFYNGVKGIGIAEMGINLKNYDIYLNSTC